MIVGIAGSRKLPAGAAPRLLVRFLANLSQTHPDAIVALRKPRACEPSEFERQTAEVARLLGITVNWFVPEPAIDSDGNPVRGREQTFARDMLLIEKADAVVCFWTAPETGDPYSGTVGLADKAVEYEKPVYAYAVNEDGVLEEVGQHDPKARWAELMPDVEGARLL